tara:strand:- start:6610 stop:7008 length:399 start_codon:yes stop_codon:yes gene_type:complete
MIRVVGKITHKRPQASCNGSHTCQVECPYCGRTGQYTFGGWSVLGCRCGAEVYRSKASLAAVVRKERTLELVEQCFANWDQLGGKWVVYPIVFGLLDERKITLTEISTIAQRHNISDGTLRSRRAYFLELAK